jgi:Domain of unknown function (DUF397)
VIDTVSIPTVSDPCVSEETVNDMRATDLSGAVWRRSGHSGGDNGSQCVEVAVLGDRAAVRDSKNTDAHALDFPVGTLTAFVAAVTAGIWRQR